jgi:hypothetical protein
MVPSGDTSQAARQGWVGEPAARLSLFLAFAGVFFAVGLAFLSTRVYVEEADLFDADMRRVVHDLARSGGPHLRSKVHPLFVLFLNPLGLLLKAVVGRPRPAALLLNAAAGAFGVVLFRELLVRLGVRRDRSTLWSVIFGLSASQLFFGVFPESYSFSGASLLLLFVAFAAPRPSWARCLVAALVSFGVTTTNLVAGVLLAWVRPTDLMSRARALARALGFGCVVVLTAAALSLVQKRIAPTTALFFLPSSFREETSYVVRTLDAGSALRRAADLADAVLFTNLAAPELRVTWPQDTPPTTRFGARRPACWLHAACWVALLLAGGTTFRRLEPPGGALVRALLLWIAFNVGLHFLYGETFFLYSCHWTFAVLAVAALGVEEGCRPWARPVVPALMMAMAGLQAWANGSFLLELHRVYR